MQTNDIYRRYLELKEENFQFEISIQKNVTYNFIEVVILLVTAQTDRI